MNICNKCNQEFVSLNKQELYCNKCISYNPGGCIKCQKSPITFNRCPWNKGMSSSDLLAQNKECWLSGTKHAKYHKYPTVRYPSVYSIKCKDGQYVLKKPQGYYNHQINTSLWYYQGFNYPYIPCSYK